MKKISILFLFALMFNLISFAEEEIYIIDNNNTSTQQEEQLQKNNNIFAIFRRTKNNQEEVIPVVQTKAINIDKQEIEKSLILYKTTKQTSPVFP